MLFIIAPRMVFPDKDGTAAASTPAEEPFIVPLAVPMLAGPSAVAALPLVSRDPTRLWTWLAALTLASAFTAIILLTFLLEKIGPAPCAPWRV